MPDPMSGHGFVLGILFFLAALYFIALVPYAFAIVVGLFLAYVAVMIIWAIVRGARSLYGFYMDGRK